MVGIPHKNLPKVTEFIITKKQTEPGISCRQLPELVKKRFGIKISKSTVSNLLKSKGLSGQKGRRPTPQKGDSQRLSEAGRVLLIAAEQELTIAEKLNSLLVAHTRQRFLKEILRLIMIKPDVTRPDSKFAQESSVLILWPPRVGDYIHKFISELGNIPSFSISLMNQMGYLTQDILAMEINLLDGNQLFLDAQFRSVWSSPQIPLSFAVSICNIEANIKELLTGGRPLVLLGAPGYYYISRPLANLILCCQGKENKKSVGGFLLDPSGNQSQGLRGFPQENTGLIFGYWPWQFGQAKKIDSVGDFKSIKFAPLQKEFWISEARVVFSQPQLKQDIVLRTILVKYQREEEARLGIATTLSNSRMPAEEVFQGYMERWPAPEEGYQDFLKAVEQASLGIDRSQLQLVVDKIDTLYDLPEWPADLKEGFRFIYSTLVSYVQRRFLPVSFRQTNLSHLEEIFNLPGYLQEYRRRFSRIDLKIRPNFPGLADLPFVVRRLNEALSISPKGERIWLGIEKESVT